METVTNFGSPSQLVLVRTPSLDIVLVAESSQLLHLQRQPLVLHLSLTKAVIGWRSPFSDMNMATVIP